MSALIKPDINARRSDYKNVPPESLAVSKVFATLQGEGPLAGEFAVFVRLAGCNLGNKIQCPWCDTDFRLNLASHVHNADLLAVCDEERGARPKTIVLTGGEPLLQNPHQFIRLALTKGWRVQVETNGYFWTEELAQLKHEYPLDFLVVVSPKVNARWIFPEPSIALVVDATCFKFVVDASPSSPYHYLPDYARAVHSSGTPIYISPLNIYRNDPNPRDNRPTIWGDDSPLDLVRCRENHRYAAEMALRNGWRLNVQTHLWAEVE
jgi:7-carboxy-7-deazaguanine synthase